jgi:hypothetical protein
MIFPQQFPFAFTIIPNRDRSSSLENRRSYRWSPYVTESFAFALIIQWAWNSDDNDENFWVNFLIAAAALTMK